MLFLCDLLQIQTKAFKSDLKGDTGLAATADGTTTTLAAGQECYRN